MRTTEQFQTNNGPRVIKRNEKIYYNLSRLLVVVLLSLQVYGCGTYFMSEGNYVEPDLPKSDLAKIQIDTKGQWIQRTNLIVLRIHGKIAIRKKIGEDERKMTDEVFVVPGKHNMSVMVMTDTYPDGKRQDLQTMLNFSAKLKAGTTYFVKGQFDNSKDDDLTIELIDLETDKVVSKAKPFGESTFNMGNPRKISVKHKF